MYCGELDYMGHDPSRIPIRFVWALRDFETLRKRKPFQNLVRGWAALQTIGDRADSQPRVVSIADWLTTGCRRRWPR